MFFPPCVAFCGIVDVVLSNQRYPVEITHGVGPFSNVRCKILRRNNTLPHLRRFRAVTTVCNDIEDAVSLFH